MNYDKWKKVLGTGCAWEGRAVAKRIYNMLGETKNVRTLIRQGIKEGWIRSRMTTLYYDEGTRPERVRVYEVLTPYLQNK